MAEFDRQLAFWLALGTLGLIGFILAFLGEFVFGWWGDLGEWLGWITGGVTLLAFISAAGRFQVRDVAHDVKDIKRSSERIEANTAAISRIEANTARLADLEGTSERIEQHTSESVLLLRQIRDRLPPPG